MVRRGAILIHQDKLFMVRCHPPTAYTSLRCRQQCYPLPHSSPRVSSGTDRTLLNVRMTWHSCMVHVPCVCDFTVPACASHCPQVTRDRDLPRSSSPVNARVLRVLHVACAVIGSRFTMGRSKFDLSFSWSPITVVCFAVKFGNFLPARQLVFSVLHVIFFSV